MVGKRLAIEKWGEGRFLPLVMIAQNIAAVANSCCELLEHVNRAACPWLLATRQTSSITLAAWLRMYRDRQRCEGAIWHFLVSPGVPDLAEETIECWPDERSALEAELIAALTRCLLHGILPEEKQRAERILQVYYKRYHLPAIAQQFSNQALPDNFEAWLRKPEFAYFFSVAMPCLLLHQEMPWELFEQARQGDFDALEKLLRIDPDLDKDEDIRALFFQLRRSQPERLRLLLRVDPRQKTVVSQQDVKYLLGGWILQQSREMQAVVNLEPLLQALETTRGTPQYASIKRWIKSRRHYNQRYGIRCRLQAPEIKSLFDAFAEDAGLGIVDPDFVGQSNSIYKRLDRKAELWNKLREADKTRAA